MTKTDITNMLNEFKKTGWTIKTFNSHRKMPAGARGFPDHVLMHDKLGYNVFIEVKLGTDTLSKEQIEFKNVCLNIAQINHYFKYYELTDKNYLEIIKELYEL